MRVPSQGKRLSGLLVLILCLFAQGGWAGGVASSSTQEASSIFTAQDLADQSLKALVRMSAAQVEQSVPMEADIPLEGRCEASNNSVGFEGETRRGRLCATEYRLEVPEDADGFLIALDKQGATDVILVLSAGTPIEQAERLFISREEKDEIDSEEFLACMKPACTVFQSGPWFIGLINFSTDPQTYTIVGQITPVRLESGVSRTGTIEGVAQGFSGTLGFVDYQIEVPSDATALRVELENKASGNIDLAVRFGEPVTVQQGRLVSDVLANSTEGIEAVTLDASSNPALKEGTYFMTIINREKTRQNFTLTATLTRGTQPQPSPLKAEPASLKFEAAVGGANPEAQALQLTNTGAATVNWSASTDVPWLSVTFAQEAAELAAGASATVNVAVDIANLTAGDYEGNITFSVAGFEPLIVPVTLTVKTPSATTGELLALKFEVLEFIVSGDWDRTLRGGCVVYTNISNEASTVRVTLLDESIQEFEIPAGNEVIVCGDVVHIDTRR